MSNLTSLKSFFHENAEIAHVQLSRVRGSSPREEGTAMLVSQSSVWGTIGGGQLEYMIIDEARAILRRKENEGFMDIPLGPEIGQCCGGRVEVSLSRMSDNGKLNFCDKVEHQEKNYPHVYILGAGHVGRALAGFLEKLPLRTILIDSRSEELNLCNVEVEIRRTALPESDVRNAPAGSAFIILTHDHALDFLLSYEALARNDAAYVGMIGSSTKRASFKKWCQSECNYTPDESFTCPIGGSGIADKRPEIIAAFVVTEVLTCLSSSSAKSIGKKTPESATL